MREERKSKLKVEMLRRSCTTHLGTAAGHNSAGEFSGKEYVSEAAQL